jgi:hypothetical protein
MLKAFFFVPQTHHPQTHNPTPQTKQPFYPFHTLNTHHFPTLLITPFEQPGFIEILDAFSLTITTRLVTIGLLFSRVLHLELNFS